MPKNILQIWFNRDLKIMNPAEMSDFLEKKVSIWMRAKRYLLYLPSEYAGRLFFEADSKTGKLCRCLFEIESKGMKWLGSAVGNTVEKAFELALDNAKIFEEKVLPKSDLLTGRNPETELVA